jgi:prepilin-type N-terminal cleavage/methylation domain-containing protein
MIPSLRSRAGFTLVELLVVIAIIGILVALLLPAVQAARESARRAQCTNQLKQIGIAYQNHHDSMGFFPSAGWGWYWIGDPERGAGRDQPGGWVYHILPYIEEQALHDLGQDGQPDVVSIDQRNAVVTQIETPLQGVNCPSRRPSMAYPHPLGATGYIKNARATQVSSRLDYGANGGDVAIFWGIPGNNMPDDFPAGIAGREFLPESEARKCSGISYQRSEIRIKDVVDGTSKCYMVGEKYRNPDHYATGLDRSDDHPATSGDDFDSHAWAAFGSPDNPAAAQPLPPLPDTPGLESFWRFGSAHPGGWNVTMCDASVQFMNFDSDIVIHRRLANRRDGEVVGE